MTMTEIAQKAGVSQATVSRVLSGQGGVKKSKADAVLKAAREMKFRFKPKRPRYVSGQKNIGLFFSGIDFNRSLSPLLIKYNTIPRLLPEEVNTVLLPSGLSSQQLRNEVKKRGIAGLLIAGHSNPECLRKFLENFPHVWLNSHENIFANTILDGNEEAGAIAADHLLSKGCTRLGAILVPSHNPGYKVRINGFIHKAYSRGIEANVFPCGKDDQRLEDIGWEELEAIVDRTFDFLAENIARCEGLFCPDDRVTAILYRILHKHNISLFSNIQVVSCNNDRKCLAGLYPRPATIDFAPTLTAELAVVELLQQLKGKSRNEKVSIIVRPEIIPGEID